MILPSLRGSIKFWFTDLRGTALIACIATVLSLPIPVWNAIQSSIAIQSTYPRTKWLILSGSALIYVFSAIMPVFLYTLYRNEGTLRFPRRLRLLALTAAVTFAAIVSTALPGWVRYLGSYWSAMIILDWRSGGSAVLTFLHDPRTIGQLSFMLVEFSNIAFILILIAIFRQGDHQLDSEVSISNPFRLITNVTVIAWGAVVAINVARLVAMPVIFSQLRDFAVKSGRKPPEFESMMTDVIQTFLSHACFFALPYVVYRSQLKKREIPLPGKDLNLSRS